MCKSSTEEQIEYPVLPDVQQQAAELKPRKPKTVYSKAMKGKIWALVALLAAPIIFTAFFSTLLSVRGNSMDPLLQKDQMVVAVHTNDLKRGDIVAFSYNRQILLKRIIASAGDWINIDGNGNIYVNNAAINEPYVTGKFLGNSDVNFPFQVPENRWFVLGDCRTVMSDSRSSLVGTVAENQIIGKIVLRFWPISGLTLFK
jgi:signal peptidase I, bacterial type